MRTVKEISDLTGISVRTLHYYDEIGLLKPTDKSEAGYRLYDDKALETLQQILFFREFDIPLKEIKAVMDNPALEKNQILQMQRKMLVAKKERMERLISSIDDILKGDNKMDFAIFSKAEIEEMSGNKQRIIVRSLPYQVNKAKLIENIADLVKDKKIFKQQLEKPDEFKKTITQIPLLTTVKAGYNYMARENWEDMIEVDKNIIKDSSSYFALKIKDDSMSPILIKDDIVIIKKQQYFENGDLVVSIINKDEAIIRKGKKAKNTVLFQPLNNSYESLIFTYNEMKIIPITIVGIVKQLKRNF